MDPNKSFSPTPEQLVQMLDLQLAMQRQRRQSKAGSRTAVRIFGVLLILGGCLAVLLILHYATSELPQRAVENAAASGEIHVAGENF